MNRRKVLIFILLFVSFGMAQAQVNEFNIGAANNSIIRAVDSAYQLVYTEDASGQGSFLLFRQGGATAMAFDLPVDLHIHDVRIWNQSEAYFCGTEKANGVVGKFDIFSLFFGSGVVDYAIYLGSSLHGYVRVHDLKRLNLFESNDLWGSTVNMALIGTSTFFDPGTTQGTSVSSAWFDGSMWHMNTFFNKGYDYIYTDVTCLDDVVVATASDSNGHGCYFRTYMAVNDFLAHYYINGILYEVVYQTPVGDVLAAHSVGNKMVLAHYDEVSGMGTVLHEVTINPFTGEPLSLIPSWNTHPGSVPPYGSSWHLYELGVVQGMYPYLLQKAEYVSTSYTGVHDWLARFQLNPLPYTASLWYPDQFRAQSMDIDSQFQQPLLSGQMSLLRTYQAPWQASITACVPYSTVDVQYVTASWKKVYTDSSYDRKELNNIVHVPVLYQVIVRPLCD